MGGSRGTMPYKALTNHPNYIPLEVLHGETLVAYTCRFVGNLISPPMEFGESNEVECVDIKRALAHRPLIALIESKWLAQQIQAGILPKQ